MYLYIDFGDSVLSEQFKAWQEGMVGWWSLWPILKPLDSGQCQIKTETESSMSIPSKSLRTRLDYGTISTPPQIEGHLAIRPLGHRPLGHLIL
jgi:hypothetical protein